MIGGAVANALGTGDIFELNVLGLSSPSSAVVLIGIVETANFLVSVVELFVDAARPQRRHPVLFPIPVVASRWSHRRAG